MKRSAFFLAVALAGLSAGCGAMFGGSRQTVYVDSSPPASVTITQTGMTQSTPTTISLPRKDSYVLTVQKIGYDTRRVEIQRKMRGGILALDILFTGLLGVVVDAATGAWWKLVPERVDVVLTKQPGASLELPETVKVTLSFGKSNGSLQDLSIATEAEGVTVRLERVR